MFLECSANCTIDTKEQQEQDVDGIENSLFLTGEVETDPKTYNYKHLENNLTKITKSLHISISASGLDSTFLLISFTVGR